MNHSIKIIYNSIDQSLLQRVFREWKHRASWIVEHQGDYYVDDCRSRKEFSPQEPPSLTTPSHPSKLFLTCPDPLRGIVGLRNSKQLLRTIPHPVFVGHITLGQNSLFRELT